MCVSALGPVVPLLSGSHGWPSDHLQFFVAGRTGEIWRPKVPSRLWAKSVRGIPDLPLEQIESPLNGRDLCLVSELLA